MKVGDLVYASSGTRLMQFREGTEEIDLEKTYIGPSPIITHVLERPAFLLITKINLADEYYHTAVKVWHEGSEWTVDENELKKTILP